MPGSKGFRKALNSQKPILSDGGIGTLLHQQGADFNTCFDYLNIDNPALVADIHRAFIEAGSEIIQTNTFGANRFKLQPHSLEDRVAEINKAGVDLARRAVLASFKDIFIAGSVGPLGVRLAPFGRVHLSEARDVFSEQIQALIKAQVDFLIIETMTDLIEIQQAILAAKSIDSEIPMVASMTFTRDDRTLLGDSPAVVARTLSEAGIDAIGINCSAGPNQVLRILKQMQQTAPGANYSVMPNAGWPENFGDRVMYAAGPDYFSEYAITFWKAGARIIGGCCGTTPQHIAAMRKSIDAAPASLVIETVKAATPETTEQSAGQSEQLTQFAQKLASKQRTVIAVEMTPPRGLSTHKTIAGANLLRESGADVINVSDNPMARMRMSPWALCHHIQRDVGIETALNFPTRGRSLIRVQSDLLAIHDMNVRNIFVVMGDPTAIGDYPEAMDNYDLVPSGLIKLLKKGFNTGIDYSGSTIGYPTSFFIGTALNLNPIDLNKEIHLLHKKIEVGADFILSQPIYKPEIIQRFLEGYEKEFGSLDTPLLVGILPLSNQRHARFLQNEVPGISIPDSIHQRMEKAGDEGQKAGVEISIELTKEIAIFSNGIYLMPAFGRYDLAAEIIEEIRKD
jgi:methionine synthase / methylenetetrahydrofolate reductase(NADPH)